MSSLEFLANKSRELLNDQLSTFDSNNSKAGIFISISALFVPVTFSVFENIKTDDCLMFLFFTPIICNLIGIYYLIQAMYPKSIYHGINFKEFDSLVNEDLNEVLLFEIGINRDSFNDNAIILKQQNKNLKIGLKLIFTSAIILSIIFFMNIITK